MGLVKSNSGPSKMSTATTAFPIRRSDRARLPQPAKRSRKTRLSPGAAARSALRRCPRNVLRIHAP
eukprot:3865152-Heterocapsa_arctica.AAC.1